MIRREHLDRHLTQTHPSQNSARAILKSQSQSREQLHSIANGCLEVSHEASSPSPLNGMPPDGHALPVKSLHPATVALVTNGNHAVNGMGSGPGSPGDASALMQCNGTGSTTSSGGTSNTSTSTRSHPPQVKSSAQYRQKALQEIRNSLMPYDNNARPTSSASSTTSEPIRKSSLVSDGLIYSRDSTPSGSCAGSTRSDSPSISSIANLHRADRLLPDPPRILNSNGMPLLQDSSHHQVNHMASHHHHHYYNHVHHQLTRQHSPNYMGGNEPPPPLPPPRGVLAPPPPPPSSSPPALSQNQNQNPVQTNSSTVNGAIAYQQMQQILKRMSPIPNNGSINPNNAPNNVMTNGMVNGMVNGMGTSSRAQAYSYASSASSSSPQRGTSPTSFPNGLNGGLSGRNGTTSSSSYNEVLANLTPSQKQQLASQLQALTLYSSNTCSANHLTQSQQQLQQQPAQPQQQNVNQPPSYPHSPASLSSLYSSISSPLPSYAASSSSGRQSPTPTVSSSSEYSSVPPSSLNRKLQKLLSSGSTGSTQSICSASGHVNGAAATVVSSKQTSVLRSSQLQAWGARQAKSQSPVIMQSVKSTQVQKPVLQTAVAPTAPVANPAPSSSSGSQPKPTTSGQTQSSASTVPTTGPVPQSLPPPSYPGHPNGAGVGSQPSASSNPVSATCPPPYPATTCNQRVPTNGQPLHKPLIKQHSSCSSSSSYSNNSHNHSHAAIPPPPPYASAVQQHHQHQPSTSKRILNNYEVDSSQPPPPPPPPYTATLATVTQDCEILPGYSAPSSRQGIHVPTPDPPSYASSVAALAIQKAGSSCSTAGSSSSCAKGSNLPNQIPARPPPPLPPNSDLVNTVESICASQVGAIHTNGPALPPKPCSVSQQFNDTNSIISATESDCSSASNSTSNLPKSCAVPVSSAPRRPAPPPPPSSVPSLASGGSQEDQSNEGSSHKTTHHSPMPPRKMLSKEKEQERREVKVKNYSPAAYKFFMEQHVENLHRGWNQRKHRRQKLESEMDKVNLPAEDRLQMRKMLSQKESNYLRLKRAKMDKSMFVKLKTIGVGAFGEVALVRKVDTNQLYAKKTLRKKDVLTRNQVAHVKAERDILAEADNEWVVKLYYSFQDADNLYFVMDYIAGGDLMSLLIKFGIFKESLARFYIAELVLAVESVHKMGFTHRDIKPDNILIDKKGHIKLTDFGLCTGFRWTHNSRYYQRNNGIDHSRQDSMEAQEWTNPCHCGAANSPKPLERRKRKEHQRCQAHSLVGTPNYIAPEVLNRKISGYTQSCDWWSVGVILYEMVVGQPPFYANTPEETQNKVINWKSTLHIPKEAELSVHATDLILKLCCDSASRLGGNGAEEIKKHPFFEGIDFDSDLRKLEAPYIPQIRHPTDTSNFDAIDPEKLHNSSESNGHNAYDDYVNAGNYTKNGNLPDHAFFEFTYRRFFDDSTGRITLDSDGGLPSSSASDNGQGSPVYV